MQTVYHLKFEWICFETRLAEIDAQCTIILKTLSQTIGVEMANSWIMYISPVFMIRGHHINVIILSASASLLLLGHTWVVSTLLWAPMILTEWRPSQSRGSLSVRAPDSWSKGFEFEPRQERRENFLLQSQFCMLTRILCPFHPRVTAVVRKRPRSLCKTGRLHLNTHIPLTQRSRSGLTMPLSRHSAGTY